jgi:group I intron endonuclease
VKKTGIYKIINVINNKVYIGSSSNILKRFNEHKSYLRKNKHPNYYLQCSWNKYGKDNFEFHIVEECYEDILVDREDFWMRYYDSMNRDKGYNLVLADRHDISEETRNKMSLARIGKTPWNKGKKLSEETKKEISKTKTGQKHTKESKEKISNSLLGNKRTVGYKHTEETKEKIRAAAMGNKRAMGNKHTEEAKEKIGMAHIGNKYNLGRKCTEETKEKIRKIHIGNKYNLGRKCTEETKEKIRAVAIGRKHTEETKQKMSSAAKERWRREKMLT